LEIFNRNLKYEKILRAVNSVPAIAILCLTTFGLDFPVQASSNAYESGRDHGCDDARISDPSDRYINQPGKGPSFHTGEFMDGYNAGFNQCSSSGGGNNNDNNDNSDSNRQSGYAQGKSDYQNGRAYNDTCNPDISDLACALYKADYAAGWGATGILRPETRGN
jgi:hypothetical protein